VTTKSSKKATSPAIVSTSTDHVAGTRIVRDGHTLRELITAARQTGKTIGLVPTMGALHEGHLSLVDAARAECDLAVVTIFVNPTQFAPSEDYRRYPRDMDRDLALLGERGCDIVFAPNESEMYAPGHATFIDVGQLGTVLEGEFRPTHFRGVATIVLKLFLLAPAHRAYFGRKDYQQTLVVRQMISDLNVPLELRVCPIVREPDGLAMSSRNAYLTPDEHERAVALSRSLRLAERLVREGERDVETIRRAMLSELEAVGGIDVQYIALVADGTVTPVTSIDNPTTIAVAATIGKTRLIDNTLVKLVR
jgi:pantoate--beta-alanine ligase